MKPIQSSSNLQSPNCATPSAPGPGLYQGELFPTSHFTQRWRAGRSSWRHTSEGGFDPRRYEVAEIPDDATAKNYVVVHHYSATYPAAVHRYGMYEGGRLVGVAVLSVPAQKKVVTSVFPDLEAYSESLELGRFVLDDCVPANGESWFIARMFELAARAGVRGVVSFADPVARTDVNNNTIFVGHIGVIYMASNAQYLGRGTPRTLLLLPDGHVLNDRTLQKIRGQECGSHYSEQVLVNLGASPRQEQEDPKVWLSQALKDIGVRRLYHGGNHRYAFRIGPKRKLVRIGLVSHAYPKTGDGSGSILQ